MAKKKLLLETTFNRYALTEVIGEGGSGQVWSAKDAEARPVAVKILRPNSATTSRRKRFQNEIVFCERTKHANVVKVLDHGLAPDGDARTPFLVMPLLTSSYRKVLTGEADFPKRLEHFDQMLSGIEAAHLQRVTHRDLKPENVLYDAASDTVMVGDFGIANFQDEALYTAVETGNSERLANFQYAAPEQRERGGATDYRTDIFALGLMLNELFTGKIPHGQGYTLLADVAPQYAWLDAIVAEMIQSDPNRRPDSIDSVKKKLLSHEQDYVSRQRLSEIKNAVISEGEEDDPLAIEGVSVAGLDWKNNTLTLTLSRSVNEDWTQHGLHNMGGHTSLAEYGPERFDLRGSTASIQVAASEQTTQKVIDYFKVWLPKATEAYRRWREAERRRKAESDREELRRVEAEIEREQRMRKALRI